MTSDRWLVRLVGVTVCTLAFIAVCSLVVAEYRGLEADLSERLAYLLAGGLLGALTTRLTGEAPLEVKTPPGEPLATREQPTPLHRQPVGDLSRKDPAA